MIFEVPHVKEFLVRKYEAADREAVRSVCCETGFLGNAIDPVFEDRELFADFLTGYYLKHEADSAFVVTKDQRVQGYLLGSTAVQKHQLHSVFQAFSCIGKVLCRYFRYNPESRRYIRWILTKAWREVPAAPRHIGHFHINLLPPVRSVSVFRELTETYFRYLYEHGTRQIHAQVVTFDGRRGLKLFERYGFKVLNQSEITKYRQFTDQTVYLSTVVKELEKESDRLLYQVSKAALRK
jgi:hypothetical protein